MNLTAKKLREAANYMAGSGANSAHAIATVRGLFDVVESDTFGGDLGRVLNVIADELDELQARAAEANDLRQQLESAEKKAERRKKQVEHTEDAIRERNARLKMRAELLEQAVNENRELRKQVPSERERQILAMWPRFEDGEYVWFGDRYEDWDGLKKEVAAVQFERDERSLLDRDGFHTCFSFGERVKRPVQSVLDADGVEIKVGDTVYDVRGERFTVTDIYGGLLGLRQDDVVIGSRMPADQFSISPRDSWERFVEDLQKSACAYFGYQHKSCDEGDGCPARGAFDCSNRKMTDLIRRAKALAGIGVGE